MRNKKTFYIALGGVIAALSVVLMFLSYLPAATIAMPAIAGILLIPVAMEAGPGWAFCIFGAVSLLSVFFAPDKEAALFYITFFGHYPIVKKYIESLRAKGIQWLVKMAFFNVCIIIAMLFEIFLFGLLKTNTINYLLWMLLIFNVTFVVYDYALTRLIVTYAYKIRKRFKL